MDIEYPRDVRDAYLALTADLRSIGRTSDGRPCLPSPEMVDQMAHAAASRCGAVCAAAGKRARRRLIFAYLGRADLDITPTVAWHAARRVLGRGVQERALLARFGTPGRTAASKSEVGAADLAAVETAIAGDLARLEEWMQSVRDVAAAEWQASPARAAILADWARQRRRRGG